ncbi:hypothetical protein [Bradyrhizobium canariense]|uniref:hypothetical protein n=1 Tax=Bradyrhizobium canariense TaxID=255045 RepID=UPI00117832C6|nr:hypothetical protein [Bradyrhizobium canariense]
MSFLALADAAFAILFRTCRTISFWPGAIVVAKDGPPKDAALVSRIRSMHCSAACSCGIWAAGADVTRLLLRDPRSSLAQVLIPAFPVSLAESIPMVFVPALTVAVWWMAERSPNAFGWSIAAMLAGLVGSLLSRSPALRSSFRPAPPAFGDKFGRFHSQQARCVCDDRDFSVYTAFIGALSAIFPADAAIGAESYRTPHWYFPSRDAGAKLMMVLAWMIADWPVALSLTLGLLTFLAFSWLFSDQFRMRLHRARPDLGFAAIHFHSSANARPGSPLSCPCRR